MAIASVSAGIERAIAPIAAVAVAMFMVAPRTAVGLAFVVAVLPFALAPSDDLVERLRAWRWPLLAAAALAVYATLSLIWAADRLNGFGKVVLFTTLIAATWLNFAMLGKLGRPELATLLRALLTGFAVGLSILVFEEVTNHGIKLALFKLLPFTRPDAKHITVVNDEIVAYGWYMSKRSMAAACFVLWPCLLTLRLLRPAREALILGVLAVVALLVGIVMARHDTSVLAMVASCLIFLLATLLPRAATWALAAAWIGATLLVVPAASMAFAKELHFAKWLPNTAQQRIIIWGYTAAQVPQRPVLGVGVDSTKILDARRGQLEKPPGFGYPLRTGPHAHNIYLQMWYELGAVGAVLLLCLGLSMIVAIPGLPAVAQPYALAAVTSVATIGASTWGIWQPWFLGAFALSLMVNLLAFELARRQTPDEALVA